MWIIGDVWTIRSASTSKFCLCYAETSYEGNDSRIQRDALSLVSTNELETDSNVTNSNGECPVSYLDIAEAQVKPFEEKLQWFQETFTQLRVDWDEGLIRMSVR